jgi:hypothetical protein
MPIIRMERVDPLIACCFLSLTLWCETRFDLAGFLRFQRLFTTPMKSSCNFRMAANGKNWNKTY